MTRNDGFGVNCAMTSGLEKEQTGLVRAIGRWGLVGLTMNIIIGAGIFGLPSRIFGLAKGWSIVAYLVCALFVALITLCFAEVGSRFSETGGPYLYARVAFGPLIGFEVGWLLWLARVTALAALCNLLIGYLSLFWPASDSGSTRVIAITLVVVALTIINVIGVREAAVVNNLFIISKLTPLLLFVIAGLFVINPASFTAQSSNYRDFSTAVLLLVFAFSGVEMAVIPAGEFREPQRNIAFALLTATGLVALLYIAVQAVCIGTLPGLAGSERPLVDASNNFLGRAGISIISIGALISVSGTLNSTMLAGPRLLFAMAEKGQLPKVLAATHRRFRTPYVSILVSAAAMFVLALQGTFMSTLTISTVIRLLAYVATCVALPVLRSRSDAPLSRFSVPGGVVVSFVATLLSVWLLSSSAAKDATAAVLSALLGLVIYAVMTVLRQRRTSEILRSPT